MKQIPKKVAILGCGFGGMYTAKRLLPYVQSGHIDLSIVNATNYFLFTPLLHEVATGGLSPTSVVESIRDIFGKYPVTIYEDIPESIDTQKKNINLGERILSYDYLVIATGAETHYYNTPGAKQFGLPLKSIDDANKIKNTIIENFEAAARTQDADERKALLSFVIVGGGATGVEFAAELPQFCTLLLKRYFKYSSIAAADITIKLITAGPELLSHFAPALRTKVMSHLAAQGVHVHLGMPIAKVTATGVQAKDGTEIISKNVFWLAGVKPVTLPFSDNTQIALSPSGRLETDAYLRVVGHTNIFAFGDMASTQDKDKKELPMLAQVAAAQAPIVAHNIIAAIQNKPFKMCVFKNKGSMISLGQWFAVGEIYSINIAGKFAWWIWRTVYLFKFPSWRKRFAIAAEWTANLFYPRDIAKSR
ncbi:MAG: NAD(P)/FAD-dependent oxidoreductase [Candidatus Pacebacteria bacterium]|jgi:NADH dehydrogenase|nr:NAD(P)/FAD-dependent oxidoreductase [Candidatus Paceibacterota bacterium]